MLKIERRLNCRTHRPGGLYSRNGGAAAGISNGAGRLGGPPEQGEEKEKGRFTMIEKQTEDNAKPSSAVGEELAITIEVTRHGSPVVVIRIECEEDFSHRALAPKLAALLAVEAEELIAEFEHDPGCYDPEKHRGKLQLVCIDVHFETEQATHHFLSRSTWAHVHRWACLKFKIAADAAANLEMRDGAPTGPILNESKP